MKPLKWLAALVLAVIAIGCSSRGGPIEPPDDPIEPPAPQTVALHVTVRDDVTGVALQNTRCDANHIDGEDDGRTSDQGYWGIQVPIVRPPDSYRVECHAADYVSQGADLFLLESNEYAVEFRLQKVVVPPEPIKRRNGHVRICGARSLCDDDGPFLALGASYFHGASTVAVDQAGFDADLSALAKAGATFIRIICYLDGGSINPDPWELAGNTRVERCSQAIDRAWEQHGLRTEVTIFGGLAHWPTPDHRRQAVRALIEQLRPRIERVLAIETSNEAWMNFIGHFGGTVQELRDLTRLVRDELGSRVPLASSSPQEVAEDSGITPEQFYRGIRELYFESAANLWTPHWSRDTTKVDEIWRTYRQPWESVVHAPDGAQLTPSASLNNEPIGILSSVAEDSNPDRQVQGFVVSLVAGQAGFVFHTDAGIWSNRMVDHWKARTGRSRHARILDHPTAAQILEGFAGALRDLPADLPNWQKTRHGKPDHPFAPSFQPREVTLSTTSATAVSQDGVRGSFGTTSPRWTPYGLPVDPPPSTSPATTLTQDAPVSEGRVTLFTQIWPDRQSTHGVVRAYAAVRGNNWIVPLLGIRDRFAATCAHKSEVRFIRPGNWSTVAEWNCEPGQTFVLRQADVGTEIVAIGRYR